VKKLWDLKYTLYFYVLLPKLTCPILSFIKLPQRLLGFSCVVLDNIVIKLLKGISIYYLSWNSKQFSCGFRGKQGRWFLSLAIFLIQRSVNKINHRFGCLKNFCKVFFRIWFCKFLFSQIFSYNEAFQFQIMNCWIVCFITFRWPW